MPVLSLFRPRSRTVAHLGFVFAAYALLALLLCAGCGHKRYGAVQFESEPEGAEVLNLKDDTTLGLTPVLVTWESRSGEPEYVTVQMKKKGYLEQVASFWLNTRSASPEAAREELQSVKLILKPRK